jgi:hypothetical protein
MCEDQRQADIVMTAGVTMSTESELEFRIRKLEKRQQQQRRLLTFCVVALLVLLLLNVIPGIGGVFLAISFSLSGVFIVLILISVTMGVLEHYSPSGRIPVQDDHP